VRSPVQIRAPRLKKPRKCGVFCWEDRPLDRAAIGHRRWTVRAWRRRKLSGSRDFERWTSPAAAVRSRVGTRGFVPDVCPERACVGDPTSCAPCPPSPASHGETPEIARLSSAAREDAQLASREKTSGRGRAPAFVRRRASCAFPAPRLPPTAESGSAGETAAWATTRRQRIEAAVYGASTSLTRVWAKATGRPRDEAQLARLRTQTADVLVARQSCEITLRDLAHELKTSSRMLVHDSAPATP
jgi:hypothetical protein